jgi:hypothetical protein
MVSDKGTESTSMAILRWDQDNGIDWPSIAPGKPPKTLQPNTANPSVLGHMILPAVAIRFSRPSLIVRALQANNTRSSQQPSLEASLQSPT